MDGCRSKQDEARAGQTKCEVAIEAGPGLVAKAWTRVEKAGGDLERAKLELEQAKARCVRAAWHARPRTDGAARGSRLDTESRAREVMARYAAAEESEQSKRQALERIKKEYADLKQLLNVSEGALVEVKIALDAAEDEVKSAKQALEKVRGRSRGGQRLTRAGSGPRSRRARRRTWRRG